MQIASAHAASLVGCARHSRVIQGGLGPRFSSPVDVAWHSGQSAVFGLRRRGGYGVESSKSDAWSRPGWCYQFGRLRLRVLYVSGSPPVGGPASRNVASLDANGLASAHTRRLHDLPCVQSRDHAAEGSVPSGEANQCRTGTGRGHCGNQRSRSPTSYRRSHDRDVRDTAAAPRPRSGRRCGCACSGVRVPL